MIECKGLNYFYKTWLYIIFIVRRYCKEKVCQAFKLLIDSSKLLVFCKSMESFGLYMVHFIVTWFSCTNGFITSFVRLCKLYNYTTRKDCRPSTYLPLAIHKSQTQLTAVQCSQEKKILMVTYSNQFVYYFIFFLGRYSLFMKKIQFTSNYLQY